MSYRIEEGKSLSMTKRKCKKRQIKQQQRREGEGFFVTHWRVLKKGEKLEVLILVRITGEEEGD